MVKVLIFSRESKWFGGVVNFIDLMKNNFSSDIESSRFLVGRRKGVIGLVLRPFTPVIDALRLIVHVMFNRYNCYHLNPSLNGPSLIRDGLFVIILRSLGCKNILLCFHGWELTTEKIIETSAWRKFLFIKVFCNTSCILVLAQPFKDWLVDLGADKNHIHLFTTMFDGTWISNTSRNKLNSSADIKLLFLSRFVREKGIFELLEAFKNISKKHQNIKLIFAGTGPEEQAMKNWVQSENLMDKIEFKGYVRDKDKAAVLKESHLFILPSYSEGLPVSVLEAMAAGMAVITTPVGGIPDIIEHNKNGLLLKKVTVDNLKNAIEILITSPKRIIEMGEINRVEAWEKYNAPVVTHFFEEVYKSGCDRNV